MKNTLKKLSIAFMVTIMGLSTLTTTVSANPLSEPDDVALSRNVLKAPKLEDTSSFTKGVSVAKTVATAINLDEAKAVFATIQTKVAEELSEYKQKTGKPASGVRQFFVGFKHGFWETLKYGTQVLIKAAPTLIALL